jgi:hypothetical protein
MRHYHMFAFWIARGVEPADGSVHRDVSERADVRKEVVRWGSPSINRKAGNMVKGFEG